MNSKIKKIVIAGGGTAGWMAAAMLAKTVGKTLDITLVESDDIPTVGVGEATIPPLMTLHKILNISEREFVAEVDGTFKLGISFENWRDKGHEYIHSFGYAGKDTWACTFLHFWLAGLKRGINDKFEDYCTEMLAARANKFTAEKPAGLNYAYHMDAGRYAAFLRKYSEKGKVKRVEGKIAEVVVDPENGFIQSLQLASGEIVEGDLFIDCTGFRALLIEGALHTGYEDWSHWLPCDRALAVQTESVSEPVPYTRSIAHDAGWQWRIPLQSRVGNGLVYSSRYMSDEKAHETLLGNLEGKLINEPRPISFRTGTRRKHWHKNCVALGLASGFLEPLESTSIHLIQLGLIRLMQLFPFNGVNESEVDEFNRQMRVDIERIRDFVILHYKVTNRADTRFWQYCKNMSVPPALQHRIQLFADSGRSFQVEGELFSEQSWTQVMLGQGIVPENYHPFVESLGEEQLMSFLQDIRESKAKMVMQFPSHQDFIRQHCSSGVK